MEVLYDEEEMQEGRVDGRGSNKREYRELQERTWRIARAMGTRNERAEVGLDEFWRMGQELDEQQRWQ